MLYNGFQTWTVSFLLQHETYHLYTQIEIKNLKETFKINTMTNYSNVILFFFLPSLRKLIISFYNKMFFVAQRKYHIHDLSIFGRSTPIQTIVLWN